MVITDRTSKRSMTNMYKDTKILSIMSGGNGGGAAHWLKLTDGTGLAS